MNTIPARFHKIVADAPESTAVIDADFKEYSYGQLSAMADAIRSRFPIEKPRRVGVLTGHGVEQVASILAVICSGGAYVAVEPSLPGERIRRIFEESDVEFVITGHANSDRLGRFPVMVLPKISEMLSEKAAVSASEVLSTTPAYILYTPTRTGKRKGVVVENGNVVNYVDAFIKEFGMGRGDVMLQASVCTFDSFVEELFVSLLSGAALAILPETNRGDVRSIVHFAEQTGVTVYSTFTPIIADLNSRSRFPSKMRLIIANGPILHPSDISIIKDKCMIYYSYGLSETTVRASWQRCDNYPMASDVAAYPIGKPIAGVELAILNENLEPCAPMEPGEICVLGEGVARGYVGADDPSNFTTMPNGQRVYLTGDTGMFDGEVFHYLQGRSRQVTIEGRQVEYSEIENALRQDPNVESGVVCSLTDSKGKPYLVAYFTAKIEQAAVSLAALRRNMKSRLAWFKVPEFFIQMQALPRKKNGRINLKALPHILKEK